MPPKKASQVHLVVLRKGKSTEILSAYTTHEGAESDVEQRDDQNGLEVVSIELKTAVAKKAPTKEVASRAKQPAKKTKKQEVDEDDNDDDDDDDDDVEQAEVNKKKAAPEAKRKQPASGQSDALKDLKLLFTGTFTMERKACEATALNHGATIVSSLKKADLIVVGTKPGPKKVTEIEENGYKTTDEQGFFKMIEGSDGAAKKKKSA